MAGATREGHGLSNDRLGRMDVNEGPSWAGLPLEAEALISVPGPDRSSHFMVGIITCALKGNRSVPYIQKHIQATQKNKKNRTAIPNQHVFVQTNIAQIQICML